MQGSLGYSKHGALPRGPRLDAPGGLHQVRARGSARQRLFQADAEREDFIQRLASLAAAEARTVYAGALLPKHCHLLSAPDVTVGAPLTERFASARIRVPALGHYPHRLLRTVLAHTVGVFLNLQLRRRPLDLDGLLAA